MTALEGHYRRLLGVYPPDHRRAYEQEMLGVLMAGSRPGQRFPAVAEALDLVRAGFLTRIGHNGRGLRSNAWRDACAVVGLLAVVVLVLAVLLAGIGCARKPVRRRVVVLLAPALAVPLTQLVAYNLVNVNTWPDVTAPMILMLAGILIPVPLFTFAFGLLILERRERAAA